MQNKTAETLPKMLPGVVCPQWKTCGRDGCRCARGLLHGPYYFRFWRENGRLRKRYVPRADLATVRARCQARIDGRRGTAAWMTHWRRLAEQVREVECHEPA